MLNRRKKYLHVALNSTLSEAHDIIRQLPPSDRIILEAGTPIIKEYGVEGIRNIRDWWAWRLSGTEFEPYIVADMKTMDRGETEVLIAKQGGASAVIALGQAPIETINAFIASCQKLKMDSYVDMMNIDQPAKVLRNLKKLPTVVLLHRGVDEETFNKNKPIPYIHINKVRASYDVMIGIGGGDTIREVQRAAFNGADIVMVWKEFYKSSSDTGVLAEEFLREIK